MSFLHLMTVFSWKRILLSLSFGCYWMGYHSYENIQTAKDMNLMTVVVVWNMTYVLLSLSKME